MIKKAEFVTKLSRANSKTDDVFSETSVIKMRKSADTDNKELFSSKENAFEVSKKSETISHKDNKSENKKDVKVSVNAKNVKGQSSDTKTTKRSEGKVKDVDSKKRGQAMRRLRGSVHTIQALSMLSRCPLSNISRSFKF